MERNKKMADVTAKHYFHTKKKIEELRAKREELWQRNKTERSAEILSETFTISSKIEVANEELNFYAHLIVKYLYGEGEDEQ